MYEYKITKKTSQFYCGKHLPSFLQERRKAGLLDITAQYEEAAKDALAVLSTSTPEEIEEESSAPKKKATTKKSVK
jgi:hypothetical protein